MDQKNKRILIIVGAVIIVVVAVALWWFTRSTPEPVINNATVNKNTNVVVVNVNTQAPANQNTNTNTDTSVALIRLANLFTERFGSYSTQAQFQNVIDLKPFMTTKMQKWADTYVANQKKLVVNATGYTIIATKVLTTTITSQTGTTAEVRLTTLRTEEGTTINGQTSYNQDIILHLVKQDANWVVDEAQWQAK
jgi:hypothetical protein